MLLDKQLIYLVAIYVIATVCTFALDWQLPGFSQVADFSKKIDMDRYIIPDYMTYWQMSHFFTRLCLGYFCPKYWHAIFVIDFGWETLEWYQWNAHNWYDLIWNMLGLICGIMIRHYGLFERFLGKDKAEKTSDGGVSDKEEKGSDVASPERSKIPKESVGKNVTIPVDGVGVPDPSIDNIKSVGEVLVLPDATPGEVVGIVPGIEKVHRRHKKEKRRDAREERKEKKYSK